MENENTLSTDRCLYTVKQFVDAHPWTKEGGLRNQIFNAESNGLRAMGAILKIGRKVLIDGDKYLAWIDSQNQMRR